MIVKRRCISFSQRALSRICKGLSLLLITIVFVISADAATTVECGFSLTELAFRIHDNVRRALRALENVVALARSQLEARHFVLLVISRGGCYATALLLPTESLRKFEVIFFGLLFD